jgi:hypothetical protein
MKTLSDAQFRANRQNSQFSTGPTSEEGKRKVSLNPLKHGFSGHTCFIPDHEKEDYKRHFASFLEDYKPKGRTEEFLVQSLAELSWSTQQIRAVSTNLMSLLGTQNTAFNAEDDTMTYNLAQATNLAAHLKEINLLGIYEQRKLRLFNTTRKELLQVQAERKLAEKEELETAAHFRQTSPSTWQPAEDGFVCSLEEIDRYIARTERLKTMAGGQRTAI